MSIAAIVVNYNDVIDTQKFVTEISKYEIVDKIVIVDNMSSHEGTMDELKKLENNKVVAIQSDKNGGYDYGNNFGIRYLESCNEEYDYYIISNPDIMISEDAIKHCIDNMEKNKEIAVIAPRMYNKEEKPIRRSSWKMRTFWLDIVHSCRTMELLFYKVLRNGEYSQKEYDENELLEVEAISGAFFIIRSDVMKKMGLLDENVFLFYEEDILAKRISNMEMKTVSLNSEKFIHFESQTIGKTFSYYRKMLQMYKSKMYYHITYNKINVFQKLLFKFMFGIRVIELFIEIPLRKLFAQ